MEKDSLKILFSASECVPIIKVGGLGDVISSLPKTLKNLGVDVRVVIPKYEIIDEKKWNLKQISRFYLDGEEVFVWQGFLPKSNVLIYLLENKKYLSRGGIYSLSNDFKGFERFLFFSKAVLEIFPKIGWKPDILHCHEWQTAFVAPLLKLKTQPQPISNGLGCPAQSFGLWQNSKLKTILTIHNLSVQGKWKTEEIFKFLNLKGDEIEGFKIRDKDGDFNLLQQGILNADILTTVSPTYRKEILTKKQGEGLEKDLRENKRKLFGILNGIDTEIYNPEKDPNLKKNFSFKTIEKKSQNKIELQKILKLKTDTNIPLFSFIGRLTSQKGLDLFEKITPPLSHLKSQIVFLGVGEKKYEKMLINFSKKYKNVSAQIKFDEKLARKIYTGSDIILIPSLFEPCGLIQMIAQRYGTIPVARETGGLADTIEDGKTGFLFKKYTPENFLKAIERTLKVFQNKKNWQKMIKKAMSKDFSWKKSAREYLKIYQKLI